VRRAIIVLLLIATSLCAAETVPLLRAHAHNDYEHARPLLDALDRGFCSIEADVYLIDGALLVAHDRKDVKPERTLAALYLAPLLERVKRNGGRVYRGGPTITLLVDFKSEAVATYAALHKELERYAEMLTTFRGDRTEQRAVTIIVSGNRPKNEMASQPVRYAALDGRTMDLDTNPSPALVPLVSDNWQKLFAWRWEGTMPDDQRVALRAWIDRAHAQGRKVRFWNTPDRPDAWAMLLEAGVDVIGTDDLIGLQRFLAGKQR
jgi:glycerophosphoryl diester phosphodiesterase